MWTAKRCSYEKKLAHLISNTNATFYFKFWKISWIGKNQNLKGKSVVVSNAQESDMIFWQPKSCKNFPVLVLTLIFPVLVLTLQKKSCKSQPFVIKTFIKIFCRICTLFNNSNNKKILLLLNHFSPTKALGIMAFRFLTLVKEFIEIISEPLASIAHDTVLNQIKITCKKTSIQSRWSVAFY